MKKIIILALAALPFFAVAQDKEKTPTTTAASSAPKVQDGKTAPESPEVIFIELLISNNSAGVSSIRADFGREIMASLTDKELIQQLTDLRTTVFTSMPDAMNLLASKGYKFQQNYVTYDREGKAETHIVYEKRLGRKTGPDGMNRPTRPDRPEGAKPATDVKPGDKTPVKPADKASSKPVEKTKK